MEIYQNKKDLARKKPFPKYNSKNGITAFFAYLLSILIWIVILIIGLISLYTYWFSRNLIYLLQLIHPKNYLIPFWFALILVLLPVTFPFTLLIILFSTLVKMLRE